MKSPAPDEHVLSQFGVSSPLQALAGGTTGGCYRAGDLVLKPEQDEDVIAWVALLAEQIGANPDFRLARPIRSRSGAWTVSGWSATNFVDGGHEHGRWGEILDAGRALHRAIEHLPRPAFLDGRTDRWFLGDRAVWAEIDVSIPDELRAQVERLSAMLEPVEIPDQVVHSDLCGNTLLHPVLPPAIIDFSPLFRPAEYAEAILISDAVIWESAPMSLAAGWTATPERRQMLIRGCLFRLHVAAIGWPDMPERLTIINDHHEPLTEWLQRHGQPKRVS